ncbi:unnamed protein product [Rotaria sp. Silwood2]|nr:unnamed protein product [Rotaria sp. Silwood2]CAF3487220.1 unnamed protein product [Rotaria sp. Silwood2]CAF4212349.1 unnamed protein product [Rotaria sp. Silwood2]CAF4484923.1 unnamed protein product [Rotaria sp. Silwood2]CAF4681993.1 unnamed protein product [Rotaria sp. Silwood2]
MYKQIQSQFSGNHEDIVALTDTDYKILLSETIDQITINLQVEEDFGGIQDPIAIDRLLDRQLQYKQAQLTTINDRLWNSLYWTSDLTRPDRLSKLLNKILKKDSTHFDKFLYDFSQADETLRSYLKSSDRQKFANLEKHLATKSQNTKHTFDVNAYDGIESVINIVDVGSENQKVYVQSGITERDTNSRSLLSDDLIHYKIDQENCNVTNNEEMNCTKIILERQDAEKLIRYFSEHIEIKGDMISPKSIDVTLINFGSLKYATKLVSNTVLIKTQTDIHFLPLRCLDDYQNYSLTNDSFAEKHNQLSSRFDELFKNLTAQFKSSLSTSESNFNKTLSLFESKLNKKMINDSNSLKNLIAASELNLDKKLTDNFNNSKILINAIETRLMNQIKTSINASNYLCQVSASSTPVPKSMYLTFYIICYSNDGDSYLSIGNY